MSDKKRKKDQMYTDHPYRMIQVNAWVKKAQRVNDQRILVAGCGSGKRVLDLCYKGADVTAVDQSETAIKFLSESFDRLPVEKPELVNADLQEVDLPEDEFDYIYCIGVLHHMSDPRSAVELFQKACKPDGRVEIYVYNDDSPRYVERELINKVSNVVPIADLLSDSFKHRIRWWDKYDNPIIDPFTKEELVSLFEEEGFEISNTKFVSGPFDLPLKSLTPPALNALLKRLFPRRRAGIELYATPE